MLTWILNLVAAIAGIFSANVWVFILLGGSILFGLCHLGWFTLIKAAGSLVLMYIVLSAIAFFLPGWLETLIVIGLVIAFFWTNA